MPTVWVLNPDFMFTRKETVHVNRSVLDDLYDAAVLEILVE